MNDGGATRPDADGGIASAGQLLRAARERQGMHIAALAAALKVAPRKLELIETDRYDELHDATFVRALALSMCRALRIDAQPVLAKLPQTASHRLDEVNRGLNQPFRDRAAPVDSFEWQRYLSAPVIGALLLVIAAIALYVLPGRGWWPARGEAASAPVVSETPVSAPSGGASEASVLAGLAASAVEAATSVMTPQASAPGEKVAPAPAVTGPASAPAQAPAPVAATPAPVPAVQPAAPPPAQAASAAAAAPAAITGVLKMHAQAESWVEVRDRDGRVLVQRTLAAGESVGADGVLPLRVTVGNASGTQVEFRGQPVVLLPLARDNVARLELK